MDIVILEEISLTEFTRAVFKISRLYFIFEFNQRIIVGAVGAVEKYDYS